MTQTCQDDTFGRRIGFGVSPLVLAIDFTRAFTEPGALWRRIVRYKSQPPTG